MRRSRGQATVCSGLEAWRTRQSSRAVKRLHPGASRTASRKIAERVLVYEGVKERVELLGEIEAVETIASGASIRARELLTKLHGGGKWRKCKGVATVRLADGFVGRAEVHWYEAHGRGRVDIKIKRILG